MSDNVKRTYPWNRAMSNLRVECRTGEVETCEFCGREGVGFARWGLKLTMLERGRGEYLYEVPVCEACVTSSTRSAIMREWA